MRHTSFDRKFYGELIELNESSYQSVSETLLSKQWCDTENIRKHGRPILPKHFFCYKFIFDETYFIRCDF